jgi:hypothetical protein
MPNKSAQLTISLSYVDADGAYVSSSQTVTSQYQAQNHGTIDVPDTTASATSYAVPMGSIGVDCTAGFVKNNTGQPLGVLVNGAMSATYDLPDGGVFCWGFPETPGGGSAQPLPILTLSLKTTAVQAGAGSITYHTFGDPV